MAFSWTPKRYYQAALAIALCTLAAVLTMEYGFGLKPCELCTLQRIPYVIVILVSLAALALPRSRPRIVLAILAGLFCISTGLGVYHAGVEKSIFEGPSACTSKPLDAGMTIEQLQAQIMAAPVVACNQPAWEWHGVTLAGLNAVWSLLLFLIYLRAWLLAKRQP
jgi:disulfide bond formation protein DsbB